MQVFELYRIYTINGNCQLIVIVNYVVQISSIKVFASNGLNSLYTTLILTQFINRNYIAGNFFNALVAVYYIINDSIPGTMTRHQCWK